MTSTSVEWAQALTLTKRNAPVLPTAVFTGIWTTLRDYWNLWCGKNDEAVGQGREALIQDVNMGIKLRREQWSRRVTWAPTADVSLVTCYL
ncbi:hypothetical protein P3T76_000063 [Phytophthora citrophthora]|uniref:Uncharacterized protein n=1 Tax=Phytophthora citrophthora TaxID=4793 RepID=A0AAD9H0R6_9STRA|nr:hypothetical protein P3T76_000063 [Phytophthora citrophthora]